MIKFCRRQHGSSQRRQVPSWAADFVARNRLTSGNSHRVDLLIKPVSRSRTLLEMSY